MLSASPVDISHFLVFDFVFLVQNLVIHMRNVYSTYVIVQKTGISEACKVMFLNGIIVYTNQKTVYFAVYSSFPQLRIQILWQITFLSTMEHASIFFEPRRWWEVVDLNNFACLVPLHVPTIYSNANLPV